MIDRPGTKAQVGFAYACCLNPLIGSNNENSICCRAQW
jgi:hypothetical protein